MLGETLRRDAEANVHLVSGNALLIGEFTHAAGKLTFILRGVREERIQTLGSLILKSRGYTAPLCFAACASAVTSYLRPELFTGALTDAPKVCWSFVLQTMHLSVRMCSN